MKKINLPWIFGFAILVFCFAFACQRIDFARAASNSVQYGTAGDQPIVGDWSGSVAVGIGVYRSLGNKWYFDNDRNGTSDSTSGPWGTAGDLAISGDFDGDGHADDVGVFRPSAGMWIFDYDHNGTSDSGFSPWGLPGDLPVAGKWNGGFKYGVAVFRPSNGTWYFDYNLDGKTDKTLQFGTNGDLPVVGDWNGDGKDEIGIYRPSTNQFKLDTNMDGVTDVTITYGTTGDLPVAGDWNADGKDEVGVFRPTDGTWHFYQPTGVVCTPNAVSGCKACNADGLAWADDNSKCANGLVCQNGVCVNAYNYKLTKISSSGAGSSEIIIQNIGAGDFDPNKMAVWHHDKNNPQLVAQPGGDANIYAANLVKNGGAWNLYYGGWDGTTDKHDRISVGVSFGGLSNTNWTGRFVVLDHGDYLHINDASVVKLSDHEWYMAYTAAKDANGCYRDWIAVAKSIDGASWTPKNPSASDEIILQNAPSNLGAIARPSLLYDNGLWRLYFDQAGASNECGTRPDGIYLATSADLKHFQYIGQVIKDVAVEPDVQKFNNTYVLMAGRFQLGLRWATSQDGVNFDYKGRFLGRTCDDPQAENDAACASSDAYDKLYITNPGIVRDGNRLIGVWYGSHKTELAKAQISAAYLQKKAVFEGGGYTLSFSQAIGPENMNLVFPAGVSSVTGAMKIYDTDGKTLLYQSQPMTITAGETYKFEPLSCSSTCSSGAQQCLGSSSYQICSDNNGDGCYEWAAANNCPANQTCQAGVCVATKVCVPGAVSGCKVCNTDGSGWVDDNSKCGGGQKCFGGTCVNLQPSSIILGLDEPVLAWASDTGSDSKISRINNIASMNVKYLATSTRQSLTDQSLANALKYANDKGMHVYLKYMLSDVDHYDNQIDAWATIKDPYCTANCADSKVNRILTVDTNLYATKLKQTLQTMKNANVGVEAVEIGNEFDWVGFNGDIPYLQIPSDIQINAIVNKYAEMLKAASPVVKEIYPNAKVVIFGMADISFNFGNGADAPHAGTIPPAIFLSKLRNINGIDYIKAYADAVGYHSYPRYSDADGLVSAKNRLIQFSSMLPANEPVWISEWNILWPPRTPDAAYMNQVSTYLGNLEAISSSNNVRIERVYLHNYNVGNYAVWDTTNNKPYPEADIFNHWIIPDICAPNAVSGCKTCKADGSAWADDNSKCAAGQICSNGACTAVCVPRTCLSLNYNCGAFSDGCGGVLGCGICSSSQTCNNGLCKASSGGSGGGGGGGGITPLPAKPIVNKPVNQMTRAEILAAIAKIKLLLIELIQQLIIELQKQLSAAAN